MKTREVTLDKLAVILGKSCHYVLDRLRAGMPYLEKGGRGKSYVLDQDKATAWCAKYDAGLDRTREPVNTEARRRYNEAAAELKEIQLAEKRGELVPLDAVKAVWADECTTMRQRLLEIPGRVSMQILAAGEDVAQIEALLMAEVRAALTELSSDRPGDAG